MKVIYAKNNLPSLSSSNKKTDTDKNNLDITDLQGEFKTLKEFVSSKICLLKNESKTL